MLWPAEENCHRSASEVATLMPAARLLSRAGLHVIESGRTRDMRLARATRKLGR
jgi:hypothetical protein